MEDTGKNKSKPYLIKYRLSDQLAVEREDTDRRGCSESL